MANPLIKLLYHFKTTYLFVRSDIKTILVPCSAFAFMVTKQASFTRAVLVPVWVLFHLLLIDIDSQSLSLDEDKVNKPWRPLPSRRITASTAEILARAMIPACLAISWLLGGHELTIPTMFFYGLVYSYDHLNMSSHFIWKNILNGLGYAVFELGATTVLEGSLPRQPKPVLALLLSFAVICTTIHAQDLADVDGDRKAGRQTTTIYFGQDATRISIGLFLVMWSVILPWIWCASLLVTVGYTLLGLFLAVRFMLWRRKLSDEETFRVYLVWFMLGHVFPAFSESIALSRSAVYAAT